MTNSPRQPDQRQVMERLGQALSDVRRELDAIHRHLVLREGNGGYPRT